MGEAYGALAEDFKKLGPEGEAMAAMAQGISDNLPLLGIEAFQTFGDEGAKASDKIMAGMALVNGMIQAIGGGSKAAAEQKYGIDQEIAAEKKRD